LASAFFVFIEPTFFTNFSHSNHGACPNVEMDKMVPLVGSVGPLSVSVDATSWQVSESRSAIMVANPLRHFVFI